MSANGLYPESSVSPLGSKAANGVVDGDRAGSRRRNRFSALALLAFGLTLLAAPAAVRASCGESEATAIMLCQEGACTDGFLAGHLAPPSGDFCSSRREFRDLTRRERVNFEHIIRDFETETPNGIYQLFTYPRCLRYGWDYPGCAAGKTTVTILTGANDAATMALHRAGWWWKEAGTTFLALIVPIGIILVMLGWRLTANAGRAGSFPE